MNEFDRKFIGLAVAWMVAVAFVAQRGTEAGLNRAQIIPLIEERPFTQEETGFTDQQWAKAKEMVGADEVVDAPQEPQPVELSGPPEESQRTENGVATPQPEPVPLAQPPLEIRISGPVDSLVGDLVELHAETTQDVTAYAWSVSPPVRGLMVLNDGEKVVFANRHAGDYLVICSTSNALGQSAHATMPFTIRPAPPENPLTIESISEANPPPDLRDLIRRWVAEVVSENKPGEAAAVAASLRQVSNLLASGQLATTPGADALFEVERVVETTIGPANFPKWASFFGRVRDFLHPLNQRGHVQTPQQFANVFSNLAGELEAIAAGR